MPCFVETNDMKKYFKSKGGLKNAPKEEIELAIKALGVRKPQKVQESRVLLTQIIFEDVPGVKKINTLAFVFLLKKINN